MVLAAAKVAAPEEAAERLRGCVASLLYRSDASDDLALMSELMDFLLRPDMHPLSITSSPKAWMQVDIIPALVCFIGRDICRCRCWNYPAVSSAYVQPDATLR